MSTEPPPFPEYLTFRSRLRAIVEGSDTTGGRAFDLTIQGLIVLSLVAFPIETLPGLDPAVYAALEVFEAATIAIFAVEYLLRIVVAERPLRFVTSFYGLVDLVAIAPFFIATGLDLRAVRALRLLRLFRILKLVRYSEAIRRYRIVLGLVREELVLFFAAAAIVLYLAGVGIYYCEREAQPEAFRSAFDGLWWAVATLTTVGYGDVYPITPWGRVLTVAVLAIGLGIVAVPTGLIASGLTRARELTRDER